eukprot:CAMPEP_0184687714 /NCGR_PEP_ID=MMETSP0312-20130426/27361_1 /TAXON_ID=31354 /ORGANISM="Compsopogon coeruleus, Strain SAG 36.94" /LENGTH=229 /DNA_ID=CAMNT_0027144141 /DNA_START=35 /DNA_END=724 /DNA_ORIENTATION=+
MAPKEVEKADLMSDRVSGAALWENGLLLPVLTTWLECRVEKNERNPRCQDACTSFHGLTPPKVSIADYLLRIEKYANCSPMCLMAACYYIHRLGDLRGSDFAVNALSAHRLVLTATVASVKYWDDEFYNNGFFAQVGGISPTELAALEIEMLEGLEFRLHITEGVMRGFQRLLLEEICLDPQLCDDLRSALETAGLWRTPNKRHQPDRFAPPGSTKDTLGSPISILDNF